MPAHRMRRVGFAVFFVVALVGAVLLIASQIPLSKQGYDVVGSRSFSVGERMTFAWNFDPGVKYRFEATGVNWTLYQSPYFVPHLSVGSGTNASITAVPREPPWDWEVTFWGHAATHTLNVTFWYSQYELVIYRASTPTFVEISEFEQGTYHITYLIYVGLPLLIIGAILITITGKDADSRTRLRGNEKGW